MQSANKREVCYSFRDKYFECLEKVADNKEASETEKLCGALKASFESSCPPSWVKYFNEKRDRELVLEAATKTPRSSKSH